MRTTKWDLKVLEILLYNTPLWESLTGKHGVQRSRKYGKPQKESENGKNIKKEKEGKGRTENVSNLKLLLKVVTNKFSSCIPRTSFKWPSNHTALLIYSPISTVILWEVIQESFASQFINPIEEEVPHQVLYNCMWWKKLNVAIWKKSN